MRVTRRTAMGRHLLLALMLANLNLPMIEAEVRQLGTYVASASAHAIRHTDAEDPANIHLLDENFRFVTMAGNASFSGDRAYVIDGNFLQAFDRNDLLTGPLTSLDVGTEILDVQAGNVFGEVFALTRNELKVLDLDDASGPRVLATLTVTNGQSRWGNLMVLFGNALYVADNALRGFRVIDVTTAAAPVEISRYTTSIKGVSNASKNPLTDLRRDGDSLAMVIGDALELITVDNLINPVTMTPSGSMKLRSADFALLHHGFAYVTDGARVSIFNAQPGSAGFLSEQHSFQANANITDLIVRGERLYLLCGMEGYEVWDISDYGPR